MNYLKVFVFLFGVLVYLHSQAQTNSNIDSLKQLLTKDISDVERVNIYINLSKNINVGNDKESHANQALDLSKKMQNDTLVINTVINKAEVLFTNKKYKDAIACYNDALEECVNLGDLKRVAYIYLNLGMAHKKISQVEQTVSYYSRALKLTQELNDTSGIINSYYKIGKNYWDLGNLDSSKNYYLKVNDLCKLSNNYKGQGAALNTLGAIFQRQGEYDSAVAYYKLAVENHLKFENYPSASLAINNMGVILMALREYDEAFAKYEEALALAKKVNYDHGKAYSYVTTGLLYLKTNKYDLAIQYLDSALHEYELLDMSDGIMLCYRSIGDRYLQTNQLDSAMKFHKLALEKASKLKSKYDLAAGYYNIAKTYSKFEKYDLANKNFELCLQISKASNYQNLLRNAYLGLSELFELMGNYKESLVYYEKYTELRQEIYKNKGIREFNDIVSTNTQEKRIAEAREKFNKTRISNLKYIILVIVFSLLIVIILYIKSYKRKKRLLKSKTFLTQQNKEILKQKEVLATKEKVLREMNNLLNTKTQSLEKNKAELQNKIAELQKATDYKNQIFSIIGHDLKGPMGTVNNIISLIMDENLNGVSRDLMLSLTQKSAVSAYSLLENLLIWAKNEQGKIEYKPTKHKFITVVNEVVDLLQDTAVAKSVKIELNVDEEIEVYADYNMVSTIIRNLTANAIKFSNKNGLILISALTVDKFVEISVKDYGVGMSEENLKQIYNSDLHYTSKGTDGESGSGLGLQLCFDFIKINKGEYKITSEEGKGSEFTFTLLSSEFCEK